MFYMGIYLQHRENFKVLKMKEYTSVRLCQDFATEFGFNFLWQILCFRELFSNGMIVFHHGSIVTGRNEVGPR